MKMQAAETAATRPQTRALAARDLDAVIAIDGALGGGRSTYFNRRLAAARRDPERHLQIAIDERGELAGFLLGRILEGEFGRSEPELRLEAIGVKPVLQGRGLGTALDRACAAEARRRGLAGIRTTANWREHSLLRFLDRAGYSIAPSVILDCALADVELGSTRERPAAEELEPADANDYGSPRSGSGASLERDRFDVGLLNDADLQGVARVDRRHTGRDRRGYLCRSVQESFADSAIRVSLAARVDGMLAGFLMARLDYGDFGRSEAAAVIDSIGVDPMRARQGVGRALLSQLFVNLRGLRVERVETVVAASNLDLLGFFYSAGLRPAQRLAFVKSLS